MPKVLAFFGPQGSGKSEAAKAVAELPRWERMSFADPIYAMASALLGCDARTVDKTAPIPELGGKSLREILQTLGTEWGRQMVDQNIWVNATRGRIERAAGNVVIDDLRFQNEYDLLLDMGADIVRVNRAGYEFGDTHASEQDQKGFIATFSVGNEYDAAYLGRYVQFLYRHI